MKGLIAKGIPTAFSAPVLVETVISDDGLVWPHSKGDTRDESISPLYPNVVEAALHNKEIYDPLALFSVIRIGKVREKQIAIEEIKTYSRLTYSLAMLPSPFVLPNQLSLKTSDLWMM